MVFSLFIRNNMQVFKFTVTLNVHEPSVNYLRPLIYTLFSHKSQLLIPPCCLKSSQSHCKWLNYFSCCYLSKKSSAMICGNRIRQCKAKNNQTQITFGTCIFLWKLLIRCHRTCECYVADKHLKYIADKSQGLSTSPAENILRLNFPLNNNNQIVPSSHLSALNSSQMSLQSTTLSSSLTSSLSSSAAPPTAAAAVTIQSSANVANVSSVLTTINNLAGKNNLFKLTAAPNPVLQTSIKYVNRFQSQALCSMSAVVLTELLFCICFILKVDHKRFFQAVEVVYFGTGALMIG